MGTATECVLAAVVLLTVQLVCCSAQDGGCSPPAGILTTGDEKLSNNVPTILTDHGDSSICKFCCAWVTCNQNLTVMYRVEHV